MEKICSECSEPTLAQSLCTLCNKWLCYQCTDVHQHHRAAAAAAAAAAPYTDLQQQQQQQRCPDLQLQRGSSSVPPTGQGPGSYPCSLLMCHSHRQEPLELFCESCDLLCCSSCHLSSHKNHRVVQVGEALQDQQWLFESLTVQVDERRSAVENNAKEIEGRLHGVKIAHRKAENQIKMAKMIMMNELNKRTNLLIEQLEKISEDFQRRLDDQLQGAIETCGQLDHVQKFIAWATTHHRRGPVLFSKALISLQMQQLLEPSLHSDSWSPVKIKFDWDASYWMKQISTLGQLTAEGGNCTFPPALSCSSILRPQPISCLPLPPVFHRREAAGCGYQACCEPQMCCLHGISSPQKQDLSSLDKNQADAAALCNSSCVQPPLFSAPLQPQRCWDAEESSRCPPPPPPPSSGAVQLSCSRGSDSQSHSHSESYPSYQHRHHRNHHHHHREIVPESADCSGPAPYQGKLSCAAAADGAVAADESWEEESCRLEEDEDLQQQVREEQEQEQEQQQQQQQQQQCCVTPAAELRKEHQTSRPALTLSDQRHGRRSTSLEVSVTAHDGVSDAQSSRLSPSSACSRRKRRSQSIPAELAAASSSTATDRSAGCSRAAGAADKFVTVDPRQRRASDGVLCVVKETSSVLSTKVHRSPLLCYKTEPDYPFTYANEEINCEVKEKCRMSGNGHSRNSQKDSLRPRVPVVCLERLKILVSQLPPHGRRQSDPLPGSTMERKTSPPQHKTWQGAKPPKISGGSESRRITQSLSQSHRSSSAHLSPNTDFDTGGRFISCKAGASTDPKYAPHSYSALDIDSDCTLRSFSEDAAVSGPDPEPRVDSDSSPESSSSEAELECVAEEKSAVAAGELGLCSETDGAGDSEPSLEYEEDPDSYADVGSDDAESESDVQLEYEPSFPAEVAPDRPPGYQASAESELDVESEPDFATDDPQPLRSDLEEEPHVGRSTRPLLIANPAPQRRTEDVQDDEQDVADAESEDFCAVCLIGGDLLCCDRCPKVFHLSCHVPSLLSFPSGDWVCSLCRDALQPEVEYDCENERTSGDENLAHGLSACDQRKCERLTLLILSNILSAPFHEPVSPLARHYYQIIKRPMDLSVIRTKLQKRNPRHYNTPEQFVADLYLMFRNCAKFNYPDSEVAQAGRSLVSFFAAKLKDVFPDRVFPPDEAESDSDDEYDEAYRTAESGFPWPERREQSHRKRKRRNSLKSRRHHF